MRLKRMWPVMVLVAAAGLASAAFGILPAQADTVICEQYGSTTIGDKYIVQNNRWGSEAEQCITVTSSGFEVTTQDGSTSGSVPLSYPSIYIGCHYDGCSPNTNLPIQLSEVSSAPTSISYSYASGTFDAAYDIWMDSTAKTTGVNEMELMIWFNREGGIQPVGSSVGTVTVGGLSWDVWQGNNGGNDVVSYVASSTISSWSFDVMAFVAELMTRTSVTSSWYMTSIQAGFEPWSGGVGLAIDDFSADVTTGSTSSGQSIVGQGSGRCLDLAEYGTADGTPVQLWDCYGTVNQLWTVSGSTIVNPNSGRCLDISGGSTSDGAAVQLWTCNGTGAQDWQVNSDGTITNPQSGKCLDAAGEGTDNGTSIQIWECYGSGTQDNQVWTLS